MRTRLPFLRRCLVAWLPVLWIGSAFALTPTEEAAFTKIQRNDVLAYRDAHLETWLRSVEPGEQRLFFDALDWEEEAARIQSLTGEGARWRERFFEAADRIVATPIPVYVAPPEGKKDPEGWQRRYGDSLVCMAIAAKLNPTEAYREKLREMALAACRFDSWGRDGDQGRLHDVDLSAGHMARGLALAYDWHRDLYTEEETSIIRKTFSRKMGHLLQGLYGTIYWANWYTQNHNHISVAGLGLAGAAFLGEIPEASEWLAAADLDFQRVAEAMYPDGGIYEGALYWGYGRSFIVQFIEGTKTILDTERYYEMPFLENMIAFRLGCSTPGYGGVLLWADSRGYDSTGPQHVLYRMASQYRDGQGQYLADHIPYAPQGGADTVAFSLLWYDPTVKPEAPQALDYHATSWDVLTTRSGWGAGDYMLSLKAGYNRNHHTKTDAGSLSLNFGGQWLLMAPGYGDSHGRPGFFSQDKARWDFFSNATESHSTLLINGQNQRHDREARGEIDHFVPSPSQLLACVDLTEAYQADATVRRTLLHRRGEYALVFDAVEASEPVTVEWLAQVPPDATVENKSLHIAGRDGDLAITMLGQAEGFQPREATVPLMDVSASWMKTYSSKNTGDSLNLMALLQPVFGADPAPEYTVTRDKDGPQQNLTVASADWRDRYWISEAPAPVNGGENISANAGFFGLRQNGDTVLSWITAGATKVVAADCRLESASPFDAACEVIPQGGAVLSMGGDFDGVLSLPADWMLFDESGQAITRETEAVPLASGRYFALASGADLNQAKNWVTGLFPPHSRPQTIPVAAPAIQPAPGTETEVSWEAEDAPAQAGGEALATALPHCSGGQALLNFGSESPGHRVGWTVTVPEPGRYQLLVRYAAGQPEVSFAVTVDGVAQSEADLHASLPGEAGWGTEKYWTLNNYSWRQHPVMVSADEPLVLNLSAGQHEIRLLHPDSGINIDTLTLKSVPES
ncbi:MAG: heparinase II/III family protein [Verrucomicrobiota bacterium JB024]|nr:heparinase II/III family protein [Verrucomicrobiota bacterium JB024]